MKNYNAVGRRKTAVARLYLKPGTGKFLINKKMNFQNIIFYPLELTNTRGKFDISITISGGGLKSQTEAILLALSRSLCKFNKSYRKILKKNKLLTRDSRVVERKKYGKKKARKKFQFSKR
ncbi:30S ribosomal protein S9 [Candidatus Karelsulcia muelleri]|uniref:30S ribosomal protein S9 n=1 Tax=Candidatus Karelsulcia muelleri TaxID=336810 RepID=A0A346E0R8_9FLAO|nr:30S ribosomal protein S9 [Candidatus Karelsulcia muelleri]AXN02573.1 SSU ribosomal protein S9p (S16e) [Candidatus Karelsulcia muelleri]WDE42191.1 30S ribosomal protein S9 [Candidatus Karelsulcia muelleri]WDI79514.1 30S ribosomal protein S9 [Candidatus Karelsulcia muelleri]WDR78972.1 30S ribosomal protein S9 [Candidatus Karelsulcia muelleri]WDR79038.1 30S ribosomal protein S9 [Candidatus Karelsulcia muelleri]